MKNDPRSIKMILGFSFNLRKIIFFSLSMDDVYILYIFYDATLQRNSLSVSGFLEIWDSLNPFHFRSYWILLEIALEINFFFSQKFAFLLLIYVNCHLFVLL